MLSSEFVPDSMHLNEYTNIERMEEWAFWKSQLVHHSMKTIINTLENDNLLY